MSSTETMSGWPRIITVEKELPECFRQAAAELCSAECPPYAVYFPPPVTPFSPQIEHLLILRGRDLVLHRRHRTERTREVVGLSNIECLEHGRVLLYSWLSLATGDAELRLTFNTVGEQIMEPFIAAVRCADGRFALRSANEHAPLHEHIEDPRLDALIGSGFKFMNYGKRALGPDDQIEAFLFEPLFPVSGIVLFGRRATLRFAAPHLWMLTQRELVIVREEKEYVLSDRARYGAVTLYIPRPALLSASVTSRAGAARLSVTLSSGKSIGAWFTVANPDLSGFAKALGAHEEPPSTSLPLGTKHTLE